MPDSQSGDEDDINEHESSGDSDHTSLTEEEESMSNPISTSFIIAFVLLLNCICILYTGIESTDKPVYRESDITITQCILLILSFCTRQNLTYEAMTDLLSLLRSLCPFPNLIPNSLYEFWKTITENGMPSHTKTHFVCNNCFDNLLNDECQECPTCKNKISATSRLSYTTISIKSQLESMFKRKM